MNREYTRAPHRHGPENGSPNAALLIDFDNVTMGIRSNLGQELRTLLDSDMIRGKVAVQRAYADWRRYPQYIVPLSEASIDLIFAPAYGSSKKNATDIRLAIDACELVFTRPEIGTYILLSGDSDFSSLVLKLKEYGKYVIGVGLLESSSDILVQNCDEYYSYTSLSGLTSAAEMTSQKLDPWELTEHALDRMVQRSDVMRSDRLKQVMLEIDPNFDEKSAGYSKFNRFLAEAAHRGIVSLRKSGDGQYEVSPSGRASTSDDKPKPSAREESRGGRSSGRRDGGRRGRSRRGDGGRAEAGARGARPEPPAKEAAPAEEPAGEPAGAAAEPAGGASPSALRRAYDLLSGAVSSLTPDEQGRVRDSEVKRKILSKDGGFDETTLGFRKFSRFLQQAHDEGVIDLSQGEDGNYYLSPAGEGGAPATAPAAGGGRERRAEPERASRERPAEPTEAEAEVDPAEVAAASAANAAADRRGGGLSARRAEEAEKEAEREDGAEAGGEAAGRERSAGRRSRSRGMGRFRRGSRGRPEGGPGGDDSPTAEIGPVDRGADEDEEEAATAAASGPAEEGPSGSAASSAPAREAEESSAGRGGRRGRGGLGRFRRGSRGASRGDGSPGGRPGSTDDSGSDSGRGGGSGTATAEGGVGARESDGDGRSGARAGGRAPGAAASRPDDPARDQAIEHMIRNYPGVGRKTAERLVDEFGDDVFEVMDADPGRVTELLTEHRARAVLDAREAERRSG